MSLKRQSKKCVLRGGCVNLVRLWVVFAGVRRLMRVYGGSLELSALGSRLRGSDGWGGNDGAGMIVHGVGFGVVCTGFPPSRERQGRGGNDDKQGNDRKQKAGQVGRLLSSLSGNTALHACRAVSFSSARLFRCRFSSGAPGWGCAFCRCRCGWPWACYGRRRCLPAQWW